MMVLLSYLVLMTYTLLVLFGPLFLLPIDKIKWCPESESLDSSRTDDDDNTIYDEPHYENPDYITDACFHSRQAIETVFWFTNSSIPISASSRP